MGRPRRRVVTVPADGRVPLDEVTRLELARYLESHPTPVVRGQGTIKPEFQEHPSDQAPALEGLVHAQTAACWLVRWPNGSVRWVDERWLSSRGLTVQGPALVAEV